MNESNGREPTDIELLSKQQRAQISALSAAEVSAMDAALLSQCDHRFRKVAFVVGSAMTQQSDRVTGVPDIYYAQRLRALVETGLLEAVGNLAYMRYSEVRLSMPRAIDE
jgi:hypothetical protein